MATKDILLRKKLIKEGILAAVIVIALGMGALLLFNYDDSAQTEKQSKENESASLRSEHDSIQQELGTGFEINAFYDAYIHNHNTAFTLQRETAAQWMSDLREQHHLANLTMTISPITDANTDFGPFKSGALVKSDVHLTFGALSDSSVYNFIEALQRKLPGMVAMRDIKLTRTGDLTPGVLTDLTQHRLSPLVTGELSFTWLGIRFNEEKPASGGAP